VEVHAVDGCADGPPGPLHRLGALAAVLQGALVADGARLVLLLGLLLPGVRVLGVTWRSFITRIFSE